MNKDIKDYLHLYLGCPIWDSYNKKEGVLFGINMSSINNVKILHEEDIWNVRYTTAKPILRPLSDMTEEEIKMVAWLQHNYKAEDVRGKDEYGNIKVVNKSPFYYWINPVRNSNPQTTVYLLKQGFDIFELIESGLAIDKTTLNKK